MRGQALDGERPGDTDALGFLVGLVVQEFGISTPGNGRVDFLLAEAAQFPIILEKGRVMTRPYWGLHAGFPTLPISALQPY